MSKRNWTLAQHLELAAQQAPGVLLRAFAGLAVIGLVCGVAYAATQNGDHPAKPPWSEQSWVHWWTSDPNAALVAILTGIGNAGGFGLAIFQVWYSKAARGAEARHAKRLEEMEARNAARMEEHAAADQAAHAQTHEGIAELQASVAFLTEKLAGARPADAPAPSAETVARVETAARSLVESPDAADQRARRMIEQGRVEEGFATLKQAAVASEFDAAEKWRRLGALAFLVNVAEAIEAYKNAARLDPAIVGHTSSYAAFTSRPVRPGRHTPKPRRRSGRRTLIVIVLAGRRCSAT